VRAHPRNLKRARRANRVLHVYAEANHALRGDYECGPQDLITDLCHLIRQKSGLSPETVLSAALANFRDEEARP
jgi:hypothetical protein